MDTKFLFLLLLALLLPLSCSKQAAEPPAPAEETAIVSDIFLGLAGESLASSEKQRLGSLLPQGTGLCATCVVEGSPAAQAGLRSGDILISLNGYPLASPLDLLLSLREVRAGESVQVAYLRGGRPFTATPTVAARPEPVVVATARRCGGKSLRDKLADIQSHQVDLARLLSLPTPPLERLLARFALLEQRTQCRAGSESLMLFYAEGEGELILERCGQGLCVSWYEGEEECCELLEKQGDTLSAPRRAIFKDIAIRHSRMAGLAEGLEWLITLPRKK